MSFRNLQFCKQNSIIERCGNLTDSTPKTVHYLSVQIGASHIVAIFCTEGRNRFICGKLLPRIYSSAIYQRTTISHISTSGRTRGLKACRKGTKNILNLHKLFLRALGFIHYYNKLHRSIFSVPGLIQKCL